MADVFELEGRRYERTGEKRAPKLGEVFMTYNGREALRCKTESFKVREILREIPAETPATVTPAQFTVSLNTSQGPVYLLFADAQSAMEEMGRANLETLRRWVASLERKAQEKAAVKS